VVCSIEESNDVTTLSINELQSSLLVQEQHMKSPNQDFEIEQALKVSNGGRGYVGYCRGKGSSSVRGRINKASVECFKCHKLGHYQNECPLWEENANFVEFEDGELLMMAQSCLNTNAKDEVWFLVSGCSNHMIGTKDWLFDFDSEFRESVKLGDDSRMSVMGREAEEDELHNGLTLFSTSSDPGTFDETSKMKVWRESMKQEIESIESNNTWELTDLPAGCKKIGVKWIYKTKLNEKGEIEKYKARLVA